MKTNIEPLYKLTEANQHRAANPQTSAWVSASAGSGKTKVLTDRVLNLLLSGVSPQRILCLTFTKAAAAEMAQRINSELGSWAVSNSNDLESKLIILTQGSVNLSQMNLARRLLAQVLEVP
ncbi:MAG: UvrD-helicase domain-containing protein, partial [Alphaproteobacteria bacterium]|nr:UvrD-helicase domain-containing protein [Alphaproteobacteria bacterium]